MAPGGPPEESVEADKARYRRKLAEWRAMGFDVSALEVLLETDFERFKEKRFELMRRQIHGGGPGPAGPSPPTPQPAGPPPPEAPRTHAPEAHRAAPVPRRPGLHPHFARAPGAGDGPSPPGGHAPAERIHTEMRYPSARRRRPESKVRTFSVAVELAEEKRARPAGRPRTRTGEPPEGTRGWAGDEVERDAEEAPPPSLGYFTPASRVPMKRPERPGRRPGRVPRKPAGRPPGAGGRTVRLRKIKRQASPEGTGPRRGSRRALGALAVVLIIALAAAGWYFLSGARTTLWARADFPATGEAGELLTFDGGNSSSTGKGLSRYEWTFGDGTRAGGRKVTHYYNEPATYTVSLVVQDQDGSRSAPFRAPITIQPLSVTVPAMRLGDRASYSVNATVDVRNTDTYLYTISVAGQQVTVSEVTLDLAGNLTQWVRDQVTGKDGFGTNHSALWTTSSETLLISGRAQTNLVTVPLSGEVDYSEDSFSDAASGGVFQVKSRARTTLRLMGLATGPASINSTDSLRSYPAVSGITEQFRPENIYKGQRFSQSGGQQNGTYRSGNVTYYWAVTDVRNVGGMAGLGLNITAERAYLEKNGLSEFFLDLWISDRASLPVSTHLHVAGSSGDTRFVTDYSTTMTEFKAGTGAVDTGTQSFDPDPLDPGLFASPFENVPESGPGNTSLRFSPAQAVQEASARDPTFARYLADNPRSYAVAARYHEGQFGPGSSTWNISFSRPGATTSYWVNLTRDILQQYTVRGDWNNTPPDLRTPEDGFGRMLTMHSAEGQLRDRDAETAQTFFRSGAIDWTGGTTLGLEADSPYPGINVAGMYASQERAGYAVTLHREGHTSAFSMDTGQMLYFYTHSGS